MTQQSDSPRLKGTVVGARTGWVAMAGSMRAVSPPEGVKIRIAGPGDVPAILAVQQEWVRVGNAGEKSAGYLAGEPHLPSQLHHCVRQNGVAVVTAGDTLVGYYLFDCDSDHPQTLAYGSLLQELEANQVVAASRVCARAQTAILREWHGFGLARPLIDLLARANRHRFDAVFGVVYKDNPKLAAHLKVGWRVVAERGDIYMVLLSLGPSSELSREFGR